MKTKVCPMCGGECTQDQSGDFVCNCCGYTFETAPSPVRMAKHEEEGADVFDSVKNAVAEIVCGFNGRGSAGSGYMITPNGCCVTNAHVVTDSSTFEVSSRIKVTIAGETVAAKVIALGDNRAGSGSGIDLAVIKLASVPRAATCVKLGNSSEVRNGQTVFVIGNSLGMGTCITRGIVSDRDRYIDGERLLMTDCATNHGNSGGPIFDASGKVIGTIVSGIDNAEGMNFAIKVDDVKAFLKRAI